MKYTVTFDGKEAMVEGPKVPPGMTVSAKMTGPRKVEAVTKMGGKVFDSETWEISADGKTFTYTEKDAGESKAQVSVFDKM
jgi:ABC-type oligopeptide transport system substrate-binding subunit